MRKLIIQVRAIANAYDRTEAEERCEQLPEYWESLKTKRARKPRDPEAFDSNAFPPGEGEKLREWHGLSKKETVEPKPERTQTQANKRLTKLKARVRRRQK